MICWRCKVVALERWETLCRPCWWFQVWYDQDWGTEWFSGPYELKSLEEAGDWDW